MSNFFTDLAREYTGNQSKRDILFTNIQNGKGIRVMPEETKQQPEWITTTKAAEIMELERDTVAEYCRRYDPDSNDNKIVCKKIGRDWWVLRESAEQFQRDSKNRGRPRGTSD